MFDYGHDLLLLSWLEENLAGQFARDYKGYVQALGRQLLTDHGQPECQYLRLLNDLFTVAVSTGR